MARDRYENINETLDIPSFREYLEVQLAHLPKLRDVEQLSPRVIRVLGQNPGKFSLQGTNTYIVGTGSARLIIDTGQGYKEWIELIKNTLERYSITLSHVMLTHWHGDHTGGVPDLINQYPSLVDSVFKHSPTAEQKPIHDGERFHIEGATIRALHGEGHSFDHMCFILEEENSMFTGDNILGHGTTAVEHLGLYMQTLEKMKAQGCFQAYPAHGDVVRDLDTKITGEINVKTGREDRCLRALGNIKSKAIKSGRFSGATVTEIVTSMHGKDVEEGLRNKVLEPFVAEVLKKLAEDGRVIFHVRGEYGDGF
uniref:Metallo-beta-lactamase domain-containing protein n=1 Tax=Bionectria ochroleuca TaxID=29856 RepID=A0A8H7KAC7_BIOOC